MIQYLFLDTSKLLNISDITKRIGNFSSADSTFYGVPYPELAFLAPTCYRGRLYLHISNPWGLFFDLGTL